MAPITPFIWLTDGDPQSQAAYYCGIFPWSSITQQNGFVTTFSVFDQSLSLLRGGPHPSAQLNPSISFSLRIKDKELTKTIRENLSEGGTVMMPFDEYFWSPAYGRCNDKYGVSRQVMYDTSEDPGHEKNILIPSLLFVQNNTGKAQEAMEFYTTIFPNSKIHTTRPYGENAMNEQPTHLAHAEFFLNNQVFIAADSGQNHQFNFNDGVSLCISCKDQAEVDRYREKLIADGGQEVQCGRCKDKFWVSRQVTPVQLPAALFDADPAKAQFAMQAMMQMKKIVIAELYAQ